MMKLLVLVACVAVTFANEIRIYNNCPFTIWPGILGNPGKGQPENGGFQLDAYQTRSVWVAGDWAGRIWGRRNCDGAGNCGTGGCGGIQCDGRSGATPASLAEITFNGAYGLDTYDVSLVDGYNLPVKMAPISGYEKRDGGHYDCTPAGCFTDLLQWCPGDKIIWSGSDRVGCWNVRDMFKSHCPDAYSYDYDDQTSTFTCKGSPNANYEVVFCP